MDSSPYAAVIEDMKLQLQMWFSKQRVQHCKKEANSVAHELAVIGRLCLPNNSISWNSDVPPKKKKPGTFFFIGVLYTVDTTAVPIIAESNILVES